MAAESANIDGQLRDIRKAVRREVQQRCRLRREMRKLASSDFPASTSRVVLLIYFLSDYDSTPACEFLRRYFMQRYGESLEEAKINTLIEDLFLQCDEQALAAAADRAEPTNPEALRKAESFLVDYGLHRYVRQQNLRKGVAPTTQMVLERKHFAEHRHDGAILQPMSHHAGHANGRSWAFRWRARWQVQVKALRAMEDISLADRRAKAQNEEFLPPPRGRGRPQKRTPNLKTCFKPGPKK